MIGKFAKLVDDFDPNHSCRFDPENRDSRDVLGDQFFLSHYQTKVLTSEVCLNH